MAKTFKILILLIFVVALISCHDKVVDNPIGNKPPNTGLFLFPDSTISQQPSQLSVSWWGDDPDGTIIGYYFKWEGIDSSWHFTYKNDSTFALPIGSKDTTYNFLVSAVDNSGNGIYDNNITQNGINYGPEPFIDANNNGVYDKGEEFFDIGLIDPTPASLNFPIKNSTPVISWSTLTVLPDTSFPVMTFAWNASDLDGDQTITHINVALNDTTNFVALDGLIRLITLRIVDINSTNPEMEILLDGSDQNIFPEHLTGLKLNDLNKIYIQATDLSGAKTDFISLPDTGKSWYVKKPKGKLLIVDNYQTADPNINQQITNFYNQQFNTIGGGVLANKFDVYDFQASPLPFENVTFPETMKLFNYIYWYSSSKPRIDLLSLVTNDYINQGGKMMFSLTFEDSSANFSFDLASLKSFLPIDSISYNKIPFLFGGANINAIAPNQDYPALVTSSTIGSVRLFYPSITAQNVYELSNSALTGPLGLISNDKNLFFIGVPLHLANGGNMNVNQLLDKVFLEEFGLTP